MTRPDIDPAALVSGLEAWDALLRDILNAVVKQPFPPAEYADFASLPSAAAFERCMACTVDTNKLYFSNGTIWKEVDLL